MGNSSNSQRNMQNSANQALSIKALSWKSDSQCLFDFEAKDITKKKITVKKSGFLVYNQMNEISFCEQLHNSTNYFLAIDHSGPAFVLQNESMQKDQPLGIGEKSIWIIIKTFMQSDQEKGLYELSLGDYLKIGRVRFLVKEINPYGDQSPQIDPEDFNSKNGIKPKEDIQCRICLGDTFSALNPFIQPCNCTGSVQYIHICCLKLWLQNKMTIKSSDYVTEYEMKSFACELCKHPFPSYVVWNGTRFSTFAAKNPTCPYIVLEKLQKDTNESKSQLIVCFSSTPKDPSIPRIPQNLLRIGRGTGSEIRINDISVSREHAHMILKDKRVFLKDLNSKFGTLALVRNPIPFSNIWNKVSIQIGKTVLELKLTTHSSLFSCTSSQSENPHQYYYKHENEDFDQMRESARKMCQQPPNILQPQQYGAKKSSEDKDAFNYNVN